MTHSFALFSAVNVYGYGEGFVQFTHGYGDQSVTYTSDENYFSVNKVVKEPDPGKKHAVLKPGSYEFPFNIDLPRDIPSSYEGGFGYVRYTIKAHVDIPWALDCHTTKIFTVANQLDLNQEPGVTIPTAAEGDKHFCCLCCKSEPLTATLKIHNRSGFVPGETIEFSSEIQNKSSRTMKASKARFVMYVFYRVGKVFHVVKHVLAKMKQNPIQPGGYDTWVNGKFHIPPVPPSYLRGCNLIDIHYHVQIIVKPTSLALELLVPVEVVIGTLPLKQVAEKYGISLPTTTQVPQILDPINRPPAGLYGDGNLPSTVPHVCYAESTFGRSNVGKVNDNAGKVNDSGENAGDTDYVPMYNYYTWEKEDPVSNFTVQK